MDNPEDYAYLNQLYTMTRGDTDVQVSMYDIGAALGRDPVLSSETKDMITGVLTDIKTVLEKEKSSYPWIEEMVMDIKTMEIQLLSPNPKTGIIREIFKSMHGNLKQTDAETLNQTLTAIISA